MINEEKIKVMTKIAMYEQGEGRKYLPISKYYRSDYIGLALIKNFFLVTLGYLLMIAAVAVYFGEYLMDNIHKMNLVAVGIYIIAGYVAVKYHKAKKSVRKYYGELTDLSKIYIRDEKRMAGRGTAGGFRK